MNPDLSWCPSCREFTVTDVGRPCVWCDTVVVRKRGGWARPDISASSKINRAQAHMLHAAHARGVSLRKISQTVYEQLGYKTAQSCLEGIRHAFAREGLWVRSRAHAIAASNRQRSLRLPGETRNEFKRRRRREVGYRDSRTGEWHVAQASPGDTA